MQSKFRTLGRGHDVVDKGYQALAIILAVAALSGCGGEETTTAPLAEPLTPLEATTVWLDETATPLATVDPKANLNDLDALPPAMTSARLVGLGEATHGMREMFQLKHRLFRYLAERHGHTLFMIEANYHAGLAINEYVQGGKGDPEDLLAEIGVWPWQTEEVVALIEWMRAYNRDHDNALYFIGVDMQYADDALAEALEFLASADPDGFAQFEPLVGELTGEDAVNPYRLDTPDKERLRNALRQLAAYLADNQGALVEIGGEAAYLDAERGAYIAERFLTMLAPGDEAPADVVVPGRAIRDAAMARLTLDALEAHGPDSRGVLWAHNNHIMEDYLLTDKMQGLHLDESLGDEDYYSVGFMFDHGAFQALFVNWVDEPEPPLPDGEQRSRFRAFTVGPAPDHAHEAPFARAEADILIADLASVPVGSSRYAWVSGLPVEAATR